MGIPIWWCLGGEGGGRPCLNTLGAVTEMLMTVGGAVTKMLMTVGGGGEGRGRMPSSLERVKRAGEYPLVKTDFK